MDLAGVAGAVALAILVLFGVVPGSHGVHISPYMQRNKPPVNKVLVGYNCSPSVAAAISAGSHLDPNEFCERVSK